MSSSNIDKSKRTASNKISTRISVSTFAAPTIGIFLVIGGLGLGVSSLEYVYAQSEEQANTNTTESPLVGYDIHAKINKHDASDLSPQNGSLL